MAYCDVQEVPEQWHHLHQSSLRLTLLSDVLTGRGGELKCLLDCTELHLQGTVCTHH